MSRKHVIADETAEDLAELAAELRNRYTPANATERFLVDTLIHYEWRLRRLRHVEIDHASPNYKRLQRIVKDSERNYRRVLKELESLVAARPRRIEPFDASFQSICRQ